MGVILPQDLSDAVIDCLRDDQRALEACSRTCIGWTSHARRHLFMEVRLRTRRESLLFLSALEQSAHAGTSIGDYVLDLELPRSRGKRSRKPRGLLARYAVIAELFRYVPNVQRLTMYDFDWRTVALAASLHWQQPAPSAPASFNDDSEAKSDALQVPADLQLPTPSILPHLPRLKALRVSNSAFRFIGSGEAVARHLVAFPQLCTLDIQSIPRTQDFGPAPLPVRLEEAAGITTPVIRISELSIDLASCHDTTTLDWLSSPWVLLDLRILDASVDSMRASRFVDLVQGTRCSLIEEFSVTIYGDYHDANVLRILDLSRYPRLHSLHVRLSFAAFHVPKMAQLFSSYNGHGLGNIQVALGISLGPSVIDWASFSGEVDAFAEALTGLARQCHGPGPSVTMDLSLRVFSYSSVDFSMQAQWVKDRFVSLVTAAEMDMVLVVNEVRRDGGIYLDAAWSASGSFPPVSTTERYATPPRSTPRPSP